MRGPEGWAQHRKRVGRLARDWWAEITRIGPHQDAHWPALRVGLCVTVPLALTAGLGHPEWAPYAVFGAINSAYGRQQPYPDRLASQIAVGAALIAAVVAGTAVGVVAPGSLLAVAAMALFSLAGYVISKTHALLPIPSLFLVFATGTLSSYRHQASDLLLALGLSTAAASFSVVVGQVGRWVHASDRARTPPPLRVPFRQVWKSQDRRLGALAHTLGPLIAGTLAVSAGIGHPYWAAVTATVPLVGPNLAARLARGTMRFLGTLIGVGVVWILLITHPTTWLLIAAVAVLQVITELFVTRNYGVAVIAITPMALILTYLGSPGPIEPLIIDRIIETGIGAAVSMLLLLVIHPMRKPLQP